MYHVTKMVLTNRTDPVLKRMFIQLYMVNLIIRGAIILVFLRPFRNAMRDAFRCCFGRSKTNSVAPTTDGAPSIATGAIATVDPY